MMSIILLFYIYLVRKCLVWCTLSCIDSCINILDCAYEFNMIVSINSFVCKHNVYSPISINISIRQNGMKELTVKKQTAHNYEFRYQS